MHGPSLEERLALVQDILTGLGDATLLDRPISTWLISTDRHLPQAFLGRPLREVITLTFAQLTGTPGMGNRRIEKLIDVLERAGKPPERSPTPPEPLDNVGLNGTKSLPFALIAPDDLTESVWKSWCHAIRSHRLEHENLGRFAGSLGDLPQGLWTVPIKEYADRSLHELRTMPGHGPARLGQILDVFSRIAQTISTCPTETPLAIRLLPPFVRDALLWTEGVLVDGSVPDVGAIREGFLTPLFALLEADLGVETAMMVRRRLGLDGPAETLEQIAIDVGLTRERVRQITLKAVNVTRIRWPEGRYILDNVYAHLQLSSGCEDQLDLMHSVLDACFALEFSRGSTRSDVLAAWERAGRAKRTPMDEAGLRSWASEELLEHPIDVIRRWLEEEGLRHVEPGGDALFFSNDPLDKVLLHLHTHPEPIPADELSDFVEGDERGLRLRVERDPRFIEDEFKRVLLAEQCSFFRLNNRWFVRLEPIPTTSIDRRAESISISDLVHLVVGGLVQAGVCDATVWGVHRFTNSLLRKVYGATLAPAVTPFVLASTFTRHSQGLVRHMRRRRLRWDSADGSIPVRGKRGWVDHLATTAGVPLTFDELDAALRGRFQDYESYVLKQLNLDEDEEGEANYGCQYIPGVAQVVPAILMPRGWQLDLSTVNVSEGVRLAVAKIVSMSTRWPIPKEYLRRVPWMIRLCEHAAYGDMTWAERSIAIEEDEPDMPGPSGSEIPQPIDEKNQNPETDETIAAVEDLLSRFL